MRYELNCMRFGTLGQVPTLHNQKVALRWQDVLNTNQFAEYSGKTNEINMYSNRNYVFWFWYFTCFFNQGRNGKGNLILFSVGNGGRFNNSCSFDEFISSIYTISISVVTGKNIGSRQNEKCPGVSAVTYARDGSLGIPYPDDLMVRTVYMFFFCRKQPL